MTAEQTQIKHISFPFRWGADGHAAELEQDTEDEIVNCIDLIASVSVGSLQDQPDFGITDPTFVVRPDAILIKHEIETWETRATVTIDFTNSGQDGSELDMEISVKIGAHNG